MTLEVRGLRYTYPGWPPTLQGASLRVGDGESAFLLGASGSGKSTLLRCIAGLEAPQEGQVLLASEDVTRVPAHRRRIGMLFQEPALFPHLAVWQNVAFGLRYRSVPRRGQREEAEHWLAVAGVPGKADARVDQLSGGERQRVSLARTLAAKPRAVLLDEPFSSLDRALRDELGPRVKRTLAEQGIPALWVTHDEQEAFRLGDAVWRMVDGRLEPAPGPGSAPPRASPK